MRCLPVSEGKHGTDMGTPSSAADHRDRESRRVSDPR